MSLLSRWFTAWRNPHAPLITVSLSREAMLHNLNEFRKLSPAVAPVLKSNAYGHGLLEIATILDDQKLPFLVVDSYIEARTLRSHGIRTPLLIIGYTPAQSAKKSNLKNITFVVTSFDALADYADTIKKPTKIHVKIDTGMSRQGIRIDQITEAIDRIKAAPNLILDGIASHFADADNTDPTFTQKQIAVWNSAVDTFKKNFPHLTYYHVSNTAGHAYTATAHSNLTRLGIGLYGLNGNGTVNSQVKLKPVMRVTTVVSGVKSVPKDAKIGYNGTATTTTDSTQLATLPMGYFEGIDRRLSNNGVVKIVTTESAKKHAPQIVHFASLIGRVSMNISTIRVSGIPNLALGTEVIVVSENENDPNSIVEIAKKCGTIPYDIAVHVNAALHREVVEKF